MVGSRKFDYIDLFHASLLRVLRDCSHHLTQSACGRLLLPLLLCRSDAVSLYAKCCRSFLIPLEREVALQRQQVAILSVSHFAVVSLLHTLSLSRGSSSTLHLTPRMNPQTVRRCDAIATRFLVCNSTHGQLHQIHTMVRISPSQVRKRRGGFVVQLAQGPLASMPSVKHFLARRVHRDVT